MEIGAPSPPLAAAVRTSAPAAMSSALLTLLELMTEIASDPASAGKTCLGGTIAVLVAAVGKVKVEAREV